MKYFVYVLMMGSEYGWSIKRVQVQISVGTVLSSRNHSCTSTCTQPIHD